MLPAADFATLKAAMLAHPLKYRRNTLDAGKFGSTSGWSILFTTAGLARVCSSPLFSVGARLQPPA